MNKNKVVSNVKDQELIKKRRDQMIKGAITLFKEKGFHRTTTREIAKASGFSIGTLYEYIRTKEDVLYLTCDAIYEQVRERIENAFELEQPSRESLVKVIESYFYLMDELQEEILILYQEAKSLKQETRGYILQKERYMVNILEKVILNCIPEQITKQEAIILANNIFVQGHMWGFRRWILQKQFSLEEYIHLQINAILKAAEK
ncbi:TetR/AcrR family transcriptional regulator [Bacilli bacterium]|uniref:TetR/AcrR family transcriptional regulator n=1 Tax=Oceanobacillus TaxID=182709 RepID=UPI000621309E|nr:TetR/AcrR family transcriptional regulator [Oceanobacillus caeni]KKE77767.1 TetR family transcriptional regulator [Bacilli bacterium VT-13-104]PZD87302.1 TetR/AcrR family transcriptional regulator [Bacilli bacterium]MBU8789880.1 TetR/AcrR family transcriptional regulator [Oceanobacillus caeni]PZD88776.1 TetR/AcrR family transcriptional regulator [Bacilli bacterium]PZD91630.1 TetR/AcrR family transcriptional regulator [Bacilli bacterium]